ncbi:type ISP restriction/modification enzyme [Gracilimonas sp.]|uniref:type ISP restriction/modification enzyme n=1 Tax=Gracilimonas sp. TaxID=1974203 RepID=UPI00287103E9|nr:type ISP restriction/modification enzyme [Gracilimonas sp.]
MTIQEYVDQLHIKFKSGKATEHSHRGNLEALLQSLLPDLLVTNEPKRSDVGAPDYILTKGKIPVGYIEAKDIGDPDLGGKKKNKEQFSRYKDGLPNLIFTDYLDFHLYRDSDFITSIRIAEIEDGKIVGKPGNYGEFENLVKDFGTHIGQTIRSANKLSKMMAGKARILADVIEKALNADAEKGDRVNESANNTLREQLSAFQNVLIHDINPKEFADIYAQTIAYGMFAARLHDPTLDTFDRHEAAALIPKTNPFLRKLFQYIAGYDLDDRIVWIVDGLADIFRATDVDGLLRNFGKATQQQDPIIHFYETFLAEYDPKLRKSRGVWYTPEPVVNFIVRAVDDILKDEFGLKDGLADTTKTTVKVNTDVKDKRSPTGYKQEEREVHKVQILDPAAGTGTFLAEVIKQIHKKFEGQQGIWEKYVEEHLIPRLNGFEILMASYAMAHLKLDLLLRETGVEPSGSQRFRVYLTNSLEEHHPDTGTLFANWLSEEANEANHIKRDTPVMVVLGNPPYSGESSNKGKWIMELMEDYKKEPGGKKKLQEKNSKWINDDYVKFIRYGQHFIEKNGEGVLAFINPHGYLDNPTFRGMRWNLLKTFDKIYTIDLHGNTEKKEKAPDGGKDENVFDIKQGVSINLMIKKCKNGDKLGQVYHQDLFGMRNIKYKFLEEETIQSIKFEKLDYNSPMYYMVSKDYNLKEEYEDGFQLNNLFPVNGAGIVTKRDAVAYQDSLKEIKTVVNDIYHLEEKDIKAKYDNVSWESRDGKVEYCKANVLKHGLDESLYQRVNYRLFDKKWTYYNGDSKGFIGWPVDQVMRHLLADNNLALVCSRQSARKWKHIFISQYIGDFNLTGTAGRYGSGYYMPLYLYPEESTQQTLEGQPERTPNLNKKIVQEIAEKLGLKFVPEKEDPFASGAKQSRELGQDQGDRRVERQQSPSVGNDTPRDDDALDMFAPIDLLDYIYAVLHSPSYREKYKEFLKIDFPRVPYPEDPKQFWKLVELGGELRQIHLLEHPVVEDFITTYPESGSNIISNRLTKNDPGFIPDEEVIAGPDPRSPEKGNQPEDGEIPDQVRDDGQVMGKVWINEEQYFGNVPKKAWEFYIGGYQPAEKWLKDRRDRELTIEEIRHYQKIIVALMETDRLMGEIDGVWEV